MLHFPRWQIVLILTVVFLGFLAVIPNFLSKDTLAAWPSFLPKSQMVLGLDLQGGAYLLYEVDRADYTEKRLKALTSDVRKAMLDNPRIGYTGLGVQGDAVQLPRARSRPPGRRQDAPDPAAQPA
jgi:preprotein translocase subunit SecD